MIGEKWLAGGEHLITMDYQPIEDYGVVGNLHTVALVGKNGSVDWFCFPRFDSPSVFGAILDKNKGGYFRIAPTSSDLTRKQVYWPDTNVLVTRFLSADGVGEIVDFMPVGTRDVFDGLIRQVRVLRGSMSFRAECRPAFNYARDPHTTQFAPGGAKFITPGLSLGLASKVPLQPFENGAAAEFTLDEGQRTSFELYKLSSPKDDQRLGLSDQESELLFHNTIEYWRRWLSKSTYRGRWREMVHRSALVLKLLTYQPTGAIVAAPTCSLPESFSGTRNWDYRYTWVRDAAFTVYALLRIGLTEEATQFVSFLDARCHETNHIGPLQVVYGIDGRHDLPEETLDHLEGYRGCRPVRIGNGAYQQLQLDIYGEAMDSLYLYNKYVTPISYDLWHYLRGITDWVCDNWKGQDESIWEVRGGSRQFVYSKLMCWVAVDRAVRLAQKRSFPANWRQWILTRDEIYETIMKDGWSENRKAFVQQFGSDSLDAATLMMPLVFFVSPTDPRMLATLDAINRSPKDGGLVSDGLVFRYDLEKSPDGLKGREGTFNLCTFWLVEALTRASQSDPARLLDARLVFEQMLGYANHLGLYSEQIGYQGGALGNFPQALTHLALISAAFNLDRYLDGLDGGANVMSP
ncbi:MAG TPA: glycoside hydrolase family 15 protein [Bryobacteraceae bacterium]|nr:glycoside hydrolase family 15 protein [Bryobacteraceae bacterium]